MQMTINGYLIRSVHYGGGAWGFRVLQQDEFGDYQTVHEERGYASEVAALDAARWMIGGPKEKGDGHVGRD